MNLKEVQDIVNNILYNERLTYTELVTFHGSTHLEIAINETQYSLPIPYKKWRGVAVGFVVTTGGVSTENPEVEFGIGAGGISAADTDFFGSVVQDTTANEEFAARDVYIKDPLGWLAVPAALTNGGTAVWDAGGDGLLAWQTKVTHLSVTRPNDHGLKVIPFMLIEVSD